MLRFLISVEKWWLPSVDKSQERDRDFLKQAQRCLSQTESCCFPRLSSTFGIERGYDLRLIRLTLNLPLPVEQYPDCASQ